MAAPISPPISGSPTSPLWLVARVVALVITVVLTTGLVLQPTVSLAILWNVAIPLVPASLLVTPHLWRNVCPLATLNMGTNGWIARRIPSNRMVKLGGYTGLALLLLLVPVRRFLFNTDGTALAVTIVIVCVAAVALGAVFEAKAGFCNTICPLLPVERLYGQRPLVNLSNPRCPSCTGCAAKGCIDLAPTKSLSSMLGRDHGAHRWTLTTYGAFAAAFPGFVLGYFQTTDVGLAGALNVYLSIAVWMIASFLVVTVTVRAFRLSAAQVTPALAAVAAGIYYWFVSPSIATTLGFPRIGEPVLRVAFLTLIAVWYLRVVLKSQNGSLKVSATPRR